MIDDTRGDQYDSRQKQKVKIVLEGIDWKGVSKHVEKIRF
jgi:hypothetical protein